MLTTTIANQEMSEGHLAGLCWEECDLGATLSSGQVFRWVQDATGVWHGILPNRRLARLQQSQNGDTIYFSVQGDNGEKDVRDFLRLDDLRLADSGERWAIADPFFAQAWQRQPGVRLLRQDPDECFFAFLCASVAPIPRIRQMLHAVAARYGEPCGVYDNDCDSLLRDLSHFPTAKQLVWASETDLRDLGLGFRARRVTAAAQTLTNLPTDHLRNLREESHAQARAVLCGFFGVGAKIADCVGLFALNKDAAIPVDTHIWRMARTHYVPTLADKSLTDRTYAVVEAAFRDRFGPHAGWAQQTLFYRAAVAHER